jgi:hypothetical protein
MIIKLELTPEEANTLASLIDLAVKAGGVRTAAAAMPIFQKLEQAATKPKDAE